MTRDVDIQFVQLLARVLLSAEARQCLELAHKGTARWERAPQDEPVGTAPHGGGLQREERAGAQADESNPARSGELTRLLHRGPNTPEPRVEPTRFVVVAGGVAGAVVIEAQRVEAESMRGVQRGAATLRRPTSTRTRAPDRARRRPRGGVEAAGMMPGKQPPATRLDETRLRVGTLIRAGARGRSAGGGAPQRALTASATTTDTAPRAFKAVTVPRGMAPVMVALNTTRVGSPGSRYR